MIEIGVSNWLLQGGQSITNSLESGIDIGFPNLEFLLDATIGEFSLVLVDELGEQVSKLFILKAKTVSMNLLWAELLTNEIKLIGDLPKNWCPPDLLTSVSHDGCDNPVFGTEVNCKLTHGVIDGSVHFVALDEGLEAISESGPLRDEHAGLVGHWLRRIWSATRSWCPTEHIPLSNLRSDAEVHQPNILCILNVLSNFIGMCSWHISDYWNSSRL